MTARVGKQIIAQVALVSLVLSGCGSRAPHGRAPLDPRGAVLLSESQDAYRAGGLNRALHLVDSAAAYIADEPDLWFLRALVLSDLYRFDESDAAFEKVVDLDPSYRNARFRMGHNAFTQSDYFAKDAYQSAMKHYRDEELLLRNALEDGSARAGDRSGLVAVMLQIGTTYARLYQPDSAKLAYESALEIDSSSAKGHAWLAGFFRDAGNGEQALDHARRAVEIEPNNSEHGLLFGVLLSENGEHEDAVPYLSAALRREPWNRTAAYHLGRSLLALGRIDEGEVYLARADTLEQMRAEIEQSHMRIFRKPDDPVRWENYAILLDRAGRRTEARRAAKVARFLARSDSSS